MRQGVKIKLRNDLQKVLSLIINLLYSRLHISSIFATCCSVIIYIYIYMRCVGRIRFYPIY